LDWGEFNVAENPVQPTPMLWMRCTLFIVGGQFPKHVRRKTIPLILAQKRPFGRESKGIPWLIVEIGSIVKSFRQCVAGNELQFGWRPAV
jgi:hypothetical protein